MSQWIINEDQAIYLDENNEVIHAINFSPRNGNDGVGTLQFMVNDSKLDLLDSVIPAFYNQLHERGFSTLFCETSVYSSPADSHFCKHGFVHDSRIGWHKTHNDERAALALTQSLQCLNILNQIAEKDASFELFIHDGRQRLTIDTYHFEYNSISGTIGLSFLKETLQANIKFSFWNDNQNKYEIVDTEVQSDNESSFKEKIHLAFQNCYKSLRLKILFT